MKRKKLSRKARRELLAAVRGRYAQASKSDKGAILDQFTSLTGYSRSYATRLLGSPPVATPDRQRSSPRIYGEAVRESLTVPWGRPTGSARKGSGRSCRI